MSNTSDFDLLLEAVTPTEAEMVKGLLAEAGIPCLVHTGDFDMAEMGKAAHDSVRHPDVYVPKGAGEAAKAILDEAWADRAPADAAAEAGEAAEEPS